MKKYLQVNSGDERSIYNLAIAMAVRMIPLGNGARIEIIFDLENEKKNVELVYNFADDGQKDLYKDHEFKITNLLQGNRDFVVIDF